jgi:Domain of unknown function (DUF3883)
LLVLRVGYMERYDGPDTITGGGAYITANGVGGEVFNFKPSRGKCYGYAMSLHFAGVNLRRLDDSRRWSRGDELAGVDVVFIAKRPGVGQVVVGWYRNATVFHQQYRVRRGRIPGMSADGEGTRRQFLCVASAENAFLLPEDARTFDVPAAQAGHKGFPGQSNVWYPGHHGDQPGVKTFAKKLQRYISTTTAQTPDEDEDEAPGSGGGKGGGRGTGRPDATHNAAVEQAAVDAVTASLEGQGYAVISVEAENKGWDLEATKGKTTAYIEVKGTAGAAIHFELTPNEYRRLQEHAERYRVCVVCDALSSPRVFELLPIEGAECWELRSADGEVYVPLMERTAAVGAEVRQETQT